MNEEASAIVVVEGEERLVGEWPSRAAFTHQLLKERHGGLLVLHGSDIDIVLTNGAATYRIVEERLDYVIAQLMCSWREIDDEQ